MTAPTDNPTIHSDVQNPVRCTCGKWIGSKALSRHVRHHCPNGPRETRHDNQARKVCVDCGKEMYARDLSRHIKLYHQPTVA